MKPSNMLHSIHLSLAAAAAAVLSSGSTLPQRELEQAPLALTAQDRIPTTFRNATLDDLDGIVTVYVDAFSRSDPIWEYMHQSQDDLDPLYTWSCTREGFLHLMKTRPQLYFKVLTVPGAADSPNEGDRIVSISVWDFSLLNDDNSNNNSPSQLTNTFSFLSNLAAFDDTTPTATPFNCAAHLDLNMTRAKHTSQWADAVEREYVRGGSSAPSRQLYLALLATHPDWDGHGFAAQHLHWGKRQREQLGDQSSPPPMTLIASPAGYPLYVSEGFVGRANATLERLDGKGVLWMEAMRYDDEV